MSATSDWNSIRARYLAGESPHTIAKSQPVTKQAIYKRARKEGWGQIKPATEEVNQIADSRFTRELAHCTSYDPHAAARILTALRTGGTYSIAAMAAGISVTTLKSWRDQSPAFDQACTTALASRAMKDLGNIARASDNGDWKAADRMLSINPVSKGETAEQGKAGAITINLNIPRASVTVSEDGRTAEIEAE